MVTTENDWKLSSPDVVRNDTGYRLGDLGHKSRVLHLADRWVVSLRDLFELVMPIKLNFPSQVLELLFEASFNQVNWTVVNSEFGLVITA